MWKWVGKRGRGTVFSMKGGFGRKWGFLADFEGKCRKMLDPDCADVYNSGGIMSTYFIRGDNYKQTVLYGRAEQAPRLHVRLGQTGGSDKVRRPF